MRTTLFISGLLFLFSNACFADADQHTPSSKMKAPQVNKVSAKNTVDNTTQMESKVPPYFGIVPYKPNYFLPYYYTGSPDNKVYADNTPDDETIKHNEFKYQISLKVPLWENIFDRTSSLFLAYTQLSYFQLYSRKTFFRETDYEPELFLANTIDYEYADGWFFNNLNVGINHQSNGIGTDLQRGWDRFYLEAIASSKHWMISIKPWYVIDTNENNTDVAKYLGYGRALVAYKIRQHVFSLEAHSILEHEARYATAEVTWSFPITKYIKGYTQIFSGYGQSLVEYNHRTNSAGVGIALSDWI